MYKAAFLDVDGIIRHNDKSMEGGPYYVLSIDDVKFIDGALEAHRLLYEANIPVFWITIQNCIKTGQASYQKISEVMEWMRDEVSKYGGYVHATFPLLTLNDDNFSKAKAKYDAILNCQDVDYKSSFAIGDSYSDILAYHWVGINSVYQVVYADQEKYPGAKEVRSLIDAVVDFLKIKI